MDQNYITVSLTFKKEDLECVICYGDLDGTIYQCQAGPHYVCGECHGLKESDGCPICGMWETKMLRNIVLEDQLRHFMVKCRYNNKGCGRRLFSWNDTHMLDCEFAPVKCRFCKGEVESKLDAYVNHIENFCCRDIVFMVYPKVSKFRFVITVHRVKPLAFKIREKYLFLFVPNRKNRVYELVVLTDDVSVKGKNIRCFGQVNDKIVSSDKYDVVVMMLGGSGLERGAVQIPFGLDDEMMDKFVFESGGWV